MTTAMAAPLPPPTKRQRNLVFSLIAFAIVLGYVGDALWASLVDRSPIALLLLNAKPRYQILVSNRIPLLVFLPLALARLIWTKPLVWLVGGWYGSRTVDWIGGRSARGGRLLRWAQRNFPKRGWMVMIITTSNPVCLLAGSVGYSLARLMIWAVIGTTIRLVAVVLVADRFSGAISSFTDWVVNHRVPVVVASITVVVGLILWQRKRGISPLDELHSLEDAVDDTVAHDAGVVDGDGTP